MSVGSAQKAPSINAGMKRKGEMKVGIGKKRGRGKRERRRGCTKTHSRSKQKKNTREDKKEEKDAPNHYPSLLRARENDATLLSVVTRFADG